jgi:hypothetical protein
MVLVPKNDRAFDPVTVIVDENFLDAVLPVELWQA